MARRYGKRHGLARRDPFGIIGDQGVIALAQPSHAKCAHFSADCVQPFAFQRRRFDPQRDLCQRRAGDALNNRSGNAVSNAQNPFDVFAPRFDELRQQRLIPFRADQKLPLSGEEGHGRESPAPSVVTRAAVPPERSSPSSMSHMGIEHRSGNAPARRVGHPPSNPRRREEAHLQEGFRIVRIGGRGLEGSSVFCIGEHHIPRPGQVFEQERPVVARLHGHDDRLVLFALEPVPGNPLEPDRRAGFVDLPRDAVRAGWLCRFDAGNAGSRPGRAEDGRHALALRKRRTTFRRFARYSRRRHRADRSRRGYRLFVVLEAYKPCHTAENCHRGDHSNSHVR